MELEKYFSGLNWKVYNEYVIESYKGHDYIVPVFSKGIRKTYNPNINEEKNPPVASIAIPNYYCNI